MNNEKQPFRTLPLDKLEGLYTQAKPSNLPEGASPLSINNDYPVGSVDQRPGIESVYTYSDFIGGGFAHLGVNAAGPQPNETAWANPNNISFNTPGTYATVLLNGLVGTSGPTFVSISPASVSQTHTFSNNTAGNSILLWVVQTALAAGNFSVADTHGNTYNLVGTILTTVPGGVQGRTSLFAASNIAAGANTVTLTISGTITETQLQTVFSEYAAHIGPAATLDSQNNNPVPGVTLVTTSQNETVLLTYWGNLGGLPSGFTSRTNIEFDSAPVGQQADAQIVTPGANFYGITNPDSGTGVGFMDIIGVVLTPLTTTPTTDVSELLQATTFQQSIMSDITGLQVQINGTESLINLAASIGDIAITSGVLTVTAPNAFVTGQQVIFSGLTTATFLNGQVLTVLAAATNSFTAVISHANYGSATDTGSATLFGTLTPDAILTISLINPAPDSPSFTFQLPSVDGSVVVGKPTESWGLGSNLTPALLSSPSFGFNIQATAPNGEPVVFNISGVEIIPYEAPAQPANINYVKTYEQATGDVSTLVLDAFGYLWSEDVTNNPGYLTSIYSNIGMNTFGKSVTADDREYIALSNLKFGADMPRRWDGTNLNRVSQVGPASGPVCSSTVSGDTIISITQPAPVILAGNWIFVGANPGSAGNYKGQNDQGNLFTIFDVHAPPSYIAVGSNIVVSGFPEIAGYNINNGAGSNPAYYTVSQIGVPPNQWISFVIPYSFEANVQVNGSVQATLATLTAQGTVPNGQVGIPIVVAGTSVPGYDGTWTIENTPNGSQLDITNTVLTSNVAVYTYILVSGTAPAVGETVLVTNCTNGNGAFNVRGSISAATVTSPTAGTFSIAITSPNNIGSAGEQGSAVIFGSILQFDPLLALGSSSGGTVTTQGVLAGGQRKACVSFITDSGYVTKPSPVTEFFVDTDASAVGCTIPVGPANIIGRIVSFTGANGGQFFYIPTDVTVINNGLITVETATQINDNTTTYANFSFSDATLLSATSIDTQGNNLFALQELGPAASVISYSDRLMWSGVQNKINPNLLNYSFDGGVSVTTTGQFSGGSATVNVTTVKQVQVATAYLNSGNGATSVGATFTNPVTVGNTIIMSYHEFDYTNGFAPTVSDNLGNTYHLCGAVGSNTNEHCSALYYAHVTTGGALTLTISGLGTHISGANNECIAMVAGEFSGFLQPETQDGYNSFNFTGGTSFSSATGAVATSHANDVIFSTLGTYNTAQPTGYALVAQALTALSPNLGNLSLGTSLAFLQVSATGTYNPTWFGTGSVGNTVAFQVATTTTPATPPVVGSAITYPSGWTVDPTYGAGGSVIQSPLFGDAYYIQSVAGSPGFYGMITQDAAFDENDVAIIAPNTLYSVRVTACSPTNVQPPQGNLVVDLYQLSTQKQLGQFAVSLASMDSEMAIYTGELLTTVIPATVGPSPWSPTTTYISGNLVLFEGLQYQSVATSLNTPPPNGTFWTTYPPPAPGATVYEADVVQTVTNFTSFGITGSNIPGVLTLTFPSPLTAGNAVILAFTAFDYTSLGINDSAGNEWVGLNFNTDGEFANYLLYCPSVKGGPTTITIVGQPRNIQSGFWSTIAGEILLGFLFVLDPLALAEALTINALVGGGGGGPTFNSFNVGTAVEYAGLVQPLAVDGAGTNSGTATSFNTGTIHTTNTHDLIVSVGLFQVNATQPAGYNIISSQTFTGAQSAGGSSASTFALAVNQANGAGQFSPTWTQGNVNAIGSTAAFKIAASNPPVISLNPQPIPFDLVCRVYAENLATDADVLIDRFEIFPTNEPVINTSLVCSYNGQINSIEAYDAVTGNLGLAAENSQPIVTQFTLFEDLYVVKTHSLLLTSDNGTTEPSGWPVKLVSNEVGTTSINGVDSGEDWAVIAGQPGLFGFNGGEPIRLNSEIQSLWNQINWKYGHTLIVKNDIVNQRIMVFVPMITPNPWLPTGIVPDNANPTSPNICLMLNYQQLNTFSALVDGASVHASAFTGKLLAHEVGRKWSIWTIEASAAEFIKRQDTTEPLFVGNNVGNSKVYSLTGQYNDDGNIITQVYTTYGFPTRDQAQQLQLGVGRYQYETLTALIEGQGGVNITAFPDALNSPYAHQLLPNFQLTTPLTVGDLEIPMNEAGNRLFVQFSSNTLGSGFSLQNIVMVLRDHPWSPMRGRNN